MCFKYCYLVDNHKVPRTDAVVPNEHYCHHFDTDQGPYHKGMVGQIWLAYRLLWTSDVILSETAVALDQGVRPFSVKISGLVMCSFTFNPALHQNSKVFSYNLALPLIYWSSLWFTVGQKQNLPLTIDPIENTDKKSQNCMPEGLCMKPWTELNLKLFASIPRPSSWCCNTEVILGIQVSDVTYY